MKRALAACALMAAAFAGSANGQSLADIAAANAQFDQQWQVNLD
jgi:hypothetical protein